MSSPLQRYADDHVRTVDTMTAALLFAAFLCGSEIRVPGDRRPDAMGPTIALAAVSAAALFWRRSRPRTAVAVTALCRHARPSAHAAAAAASWPLRGWGPGWRRPRTSRS